MSDLTAREMEILLLVARGRTNHQIAGELGIAYRTVKHHLTHVFYKAGVTGSNRIRLITWALLMKWIKLEDLSP